MDHNDHQRRRRRRRKRIFDNPLDTSSLVEVDNILCRATADDGYDTSSITTDSVVLVTNTAPVVFTVVFSSTLINSSSTCSATIEDAESNNEDFIISYEWTNTDGTVLDEDETIDTTGERWRHPSMYCHC